MTDDDTGRSTPIAPLSGAMGDPPGHDAALAIVSSRARDRSRRVAAQGLFMVKLDKTTLQPENARALVQGYRLLIIGEHQHTTHRLPRSGEVSVGRSESADIQVHDPLMSRIHATLEVGKQLAVRDLGSSNGTIVRGERLAAHELRPVSIGDTIEIGSTVLIIQPDFVHRVASTGESDVAAPPRSAAMERIHKLARRIAASEINVLLLGETGVGKEVMARTIHAASPRADNPFVGLNAATLGEQLFESELFGYEKGAFTGATQSKPGLIETADGGTVFLDEVGEMPLSTQAKLLRVLEEREVMRVGGLRPRSIDVRFIAATNQDLEQEIEAGRFREDLFYRLNGISLVIPPLRERTEEIAGLARAFIDEACKQAGTSMRPVLSAETLAWMRGHAWPGNIRELRNAINRAVLLASGGEIQPEHLQTDDYRPRTKRGSGRTAGSPRAVSVERNAPLEPTHAAHDDEERQRILDALAACGGNQTRAAEMLGIARRTLTTRLNKLGIPRPRKGR